MPEPEKIPFNIKLTHDAAVKIVGEVVEEFVQDGKISAVGMGVFQCGGKELTELNDALRSAFENFSITL